MTATRILLRLASAAAWSGWLLASEPSPGGGGETPPPVLLDGVAAAVNNRTITEGDVLDTMSGERQRLQRTYTGDELSRRLNEAFASACEDLVDRALILQAFEKDGGQMPDWAVEREIQQTVMDRFNGSRSRLEQALRADGLTLNDMRRRIRERMIVQAMRSSKVSQSIRVSAIDVRNHYDAHPDAYVLPLEVRLRVMTLGGGSGDGAAEARERAYALRARIAQGEDFETLARQVSTDADKDKGGDWGWVDPAKLRPELSAAIGGLEPGGVTDVVEAVGDLYIIRLEERRGSVRRPFAEVEPLIERELREAQGRRIFDAWLGGLRAQAHIRIVGLKPF
jgi:peptidyl-prolyl cis-trans isomerase SurA